MKRISLLILSLLFFATAFQSDKLITQGWYQQFLAAEIDNDIKCLKFTDSLTGYIATANKNGACYLLKTTNAGDNWFVTLKDTTGNIFSDLHFFNKDTAYIQGYNQILRTNNAGLNWSLQCYLPGLNGLFAINYDTIFCVDYQSIIGGFWRTTNGGTSWAKLVNFGSLNPSGVYFYNKNIGYINRGGGTWKTTDGGFNWAQISGNYGDLYFIDSLLGYKAANFIMSKTTNGGLNWTDQQLPNTALLGVIKFFAINKDTLWSIGGSIIKNNTYYGIVYKTTNGGNNWGYQIPLDTNTIDQYRFIQSLNKTNIWAYYLRSTGVHTKVGGNDTTFFTGIKLVPNIVPEKFSLGQNYPNPFNPTTNIPFELKEPSHVTLKVFDARGREVKELVNGRWGTGKFIADFDVHHGGSATIATGIYFYQIIVSGETTHQVFAETKKMMVLK